MPPAYVENPIDCQFEGQDSDEGISLLLRAHPITNIPWIAGAFLLSILPFFMPSFTPLLGFNISQVPVEVQQAFLVINYLLALVIIFEGFLYWYFNVHLLTNKRVVDIDFHSILYKNVDLAPLNEIQEASGSVGGILGMVFNYGNVFIQTAGAKVSLDFLNVPNPVRVADLIMDEVQKVP